MKKFLVYLIHNIVNEKIYVGYTSTSFIQRWKGHLYQAYVEESKAHFSSAIRKYGSNNFSYEILSSNNTEDEAKNLERLWIITLRSYDESVGYNMTFGGDGITGSKNPGAKRKGKTLSEVFGVERSVLIRKKMGAGGSRKKGTVWVTDGVHFFRVNPNQIPAGLVRKHPLEGRKAKSTPGLGKGLIWINNGSVCRRVIPSEVPVGWFRGRANA